MRQGGENLQQVYNRGYDFILNTYGSAENIIPSKNVVPILTRGIVIEVDFNNKKNYKVAAAEAPFSVYAKIIGEDLDATDPHLQKEKIFYAPLLPMNNLVIPEIGEEILILRESNEVSSKGYYIGRLNNTPGLDYYAARQYMDDNNNITSPNFKYGFSFEPEALRNGFLDELPSDDLQVFSIPLTYGDVVQQGRSQSYIRHSFNKNNKKGVLEKGLLLQQQNMGDFIKYNVPLNTGTSFDPSIGKTATKTIHFVDTSIKRLGDYSFKSIKPNNLLQNDLLLSDDKSMIVNMADEIYDISTLDENKVLYRQVLGEKLVSQQEETNTLIGDMLNGLTGLAEATQLLLDAFIEHTHAIPKIELNLEKEIKSRDLYRTQPREIPQPDQVITIPGSRVVTGHKEVEVFDQASFMDGGSGKKKVKRPVYSNTPSRQIRVKMSPKIIPGRIRARNISQKINFEAIIGGEEDPRFTAPVEPDKATVFNNPMVGSSPMSAAASEKTEVGLKAAEVDNKTEALIELFNIQKTNIESITDKASDFLSKNQFIN